LNDQKNSDTHNPREDLLRYIAEHFPAEAAGFAAAYGDTPQRGLRANTLKVSPDELRGLLPFNTQPIAWCAEGLYYPDGERPGRHPFHSAGLYYIQEPSAMSAVAVLGVEPGDIVLDLCASPGGKATQIGAALNGRGLLVANEARRSRVGALVRNLEFSGVTNCVVLNESAERLAGRLPQFFDKILVDAPCSGQGMYRREAGQFGAQRDAECVSLQKGLLHHTSAMLKPGGRIMYSTCTFARNENEYVVENFLQRHGDFALETIDNRRYGFANGDPLAGCARLWPHRLKGEGHFLAMMRKTDGDDADANVPHVTINKNDAYFNGFRTRDITSAAQNTTDKKKHAGYEEFRARHISAALPGVCRMHGSTLYLTDERAPDLNGLRVIQHGLYAGEVKNDRFEPSHALAMALRADDFDGVADLSIDDERVMGYLRGEAIECDGRSGWRLVCIEGYPLGWGKSANGVIKNKYPRNYCFNA